MNIFLIFFTSNFKRLRVPNAQKLINSPNLTPVSLHKNKNSLIHLQPLQYKSFSRNYEEDYIVYTPSTSISTLENYTDALNTSLKILDT